MTDNRAVDAEMDDDHAEDDRAFRFPVPARFKGGAPVRPLEPNPPSSERKRQVHHFCDDIRRQMGWRPKHDNDRSDQ